MRYYLAYLFTVILSFPTLTLAAETFITVPTMDVTVKATLTLPVCNINVAQTVTLPDADIAQFAVGGIFSALSPTDYSGDNIYTPFNITLTNCGSETVPISRTLRLTFTDVGSRRFMDGVFSDQLQDNAFVGIVIFNTDGASARNVLLDEIIFTNQTATDSEQVFHFATRFQKIGGDNSNISTGLYRANVSVTAAYE
jgi:type 1 fimbria pilin